MRARMPGLRTALAATALLGLATAPAASALTATVTGLGNLVPISISNSTVIVGDTDLPAGAEDAVGHAAVWKNGKLTRLPERDGTTFSDALQVGDGGLIVGRDHLPAPHLGIHAIRWDPKDGPLEIAPLVAQDDDFSQAYDVDAAGDIVGSLYNAGGVGGISYGFIRTAPGGLLRLGPYPDEASTALGAITQDGSLVLGHVTTGTSAPTYHLWPAAGPSGPGITLDLTPAGNNWASIGGSVLLDDYANALANDGTVLGFKDAGGDVLTWWLRLPTGAETQVEGMTRPQAVNAKHVVVGFQLEPTSLRATMWDPRTEKVAYLNDLLPAASDWWLSEALAINDRNEIVGIGARRSTGTMEGFLLRFRAVISGQVAAPPLPGAAQAAPAATVVLVPLGGDGSPQTVVPDAAGRFRAEVDPGRYRVELRGIAGCALGQKPCSASRTVDASDDVAVSFRTDATTRLAAAVLAANAKVRARKGKVAIDVACRLVTRPCAVGATITRKRAVLARLVAARIPGGGSTTLRLALTKAGRKALAATAKPVKGTLTLRVKVGARTVPTTLAIRLDG